MKWFKHHCDWSRDENVANYLFETGPRHLEAYGFLCRLTELIAERVRPEDPTPSIRLPLAQWARHLDTHHNRAKKYFDILDLTGVVSVEYLEDKVEVTMPDVLKWADDYFRKSGPSTDTQRTQENRRETRRQERKRQLVTLPDDFRLTDDRQAVAAKNCPGADTVSVFRKFEAHCRSQAVTSANWDEEWVKWTLREGERPAISRGHRATAGHAESRREQLLHLGEIMRVEQRTGETEAQYLARVEEQNERRLQWL